MKLLLNLILNPIKHLKSHLGVGGGVNQLLLEREGEFGFSPSGTKKGKIKRFGSCDTGNCWEKVAQVIICIYRVLHDLGINIVYRSLLP